GQMLPVPRTAAVPPAMTRVPPVPPEPPAETLLAQQAGPSPAEGGQQEWHGGTESSAAAPGPWALADAPAEPRTGPAAAPPLPSGPPDVPPGQSGAGTTLPWTSSAPDPSS